MLDRATIQVVMAVADSALYDAVGTWRRLPAYVEGDRLKFPLPTWNAEAVYRQKSASRLRCEYRFLSGYRQPGTLRRVELNSLAAPLSADQFGETLFIPHPKLLAADGSIAKLEATLYRPTDSANAPLAVISHGSGIGADLLQTWREPLLASWLVEHGYAVLAPMRRGRGRSQGDYVEDAHLFDRIGNPVDITPSVEAALDDLQACVTHALALPGIAAKPVLHVGQSRGGFLAVVHAGRYPGQVAGVINFVGGWLGGEAAVLNTPWFSTAGRGSAGQVSQLWIYAAHDDYYNETHVRQNHAAFAKAGGRAALLYHPGPQPQDGHSIRHFPDIWQAQADEFLKTLKR